MDLVCSSDFMVGLFGALYFAGLAIGALSLNRLADIFGRKYISIASLVLSVITAIVILAVNDLTTTYIMCFFNGFSQSIRISVLYIYMLELVKPDLRQTYNMLAQVLDNSSFIFIAFMFYV